MDGNKTLRRGMMIMVLLLIIALDSRADGIGENISKMQGVLDKLKDQMIPLCSKLIGVGRGIAGFAALFYIASRVWRHLANAEPIDFYPLFRPFTLGFCIAFFPTAVIGTIDGLMKPTVTGTAEMVQGSDKAIKTLLEMKKQAVKSSRAWQMYIGQNNEGSKEKWLKYTHGLPDHAPAVDEGVFASMGSEVSFALAKASYKFRNSVKEWMSEILNVLFQAAALCINTLRTFQLIVLAIIGPFVFGIAVFDGFQHTLTAWLAKYINVFLWLPVCNIFGAIIGQIQVEMLKLDLTQIGQSGDTFFSASDTGYLVFMIIGIVGYFTVPSVAGFIVNAGGSGAMTSKVTSLVMAGASGGGHIAMGAAIGGLNKVSNMDTYGSDAGLKAALRGHPSNGSQGSGSGNYQLDKLSGNT